MTPTDTVAEKAPPFNVDRPKQPHPERESSSRPGEAVFVYIGTSLVRRASARATWHAASWLGATSPS